MLSARKTGENSNFTVDTSALAGGQMTEVPAYSRTGTTLNASYTLDGEASPRTSESNIIENAIPGVRLTLKGITTSPVSVTTTPAAVDTEAITKKITALVDAYNAVVTATRAELTEKKIPTATTTSDLQKGQLFGDTGMTSMLGSLKASMTQTSRGLGLTSLADIGISVPKSTGGATSQDAKAGKLTSTRPSSTRCSPPTTRRCATCSPARAPPRASRAADLRLRLRRRPAPTA